MEVSLTAVTSQLSSLLAEGRVLLARLVKVPKKLAKLRKSFESLQGYLDDAQERLEEDKEVEKWMSEIRDLAYEAQEVTEKHLHRIRRQPSQSQQGIWNAVKRFPRALVDVMVLQREVHRIDPLIDKISGLTSKMNAYGIEFRPAADSTATTNPAAGSSSSTPYIDGDSGEMIIGLDEDVHTVVNQLVNVESTKVVGICGADGLGKTTLAKEVLKRKIITEHFDAIAWAYLGQLNQVRDALRKISLDLLGNGTGDEEKKRKIKDAQDLGELSENLRQILENKKCLVVLDDFQTVEIWHSLRPAFSSIHEGLCSSKLVVTTCNPNVLRHVDPRGFLHLPRCLNGEEKWELFQKKLALVGKGIKGFLKEKMGKAIVGNCIGLPLIIQVLGGLYKYDRGLLMEGLTKLNKNIPLYANLFSEIIRILPCASIMSEQGLEPYFSREISHESETVLEEVLEVHGVLEMSYAYLPQRLRSCLLQMLDFPEGYEIPATELFNLWIAKGVVKRGRRELQDQVAESYLDGLVKRSLIQVVDEEGNGRIKTCQMHSLVRDFYCRMSRLHPSGQASLLQLH